MRNGVPFTVEKISPGAGSLEVACLLKVQISVKRNLFIYLLFLVPNHFPFALSMHTSPSTKHFLILVSIIEYAYVMGWKLL